MKDKIKPKCESCGLCCKSLTFWMENRSFNNDHLELKRWIEYHNCIPQKNSKGELGIKVKEPCIHLGWDKNGKSFCKIHDNKPIVCKKYHCDKVKKKAEMENIIRDLGSNVSGIHI
jgi:Fe-S-cluster containining protein